VTTTIPFNCQQQQLLLLPLLLLLQPFNCLFSKTSWVSRYQKGKTSLDLNEARDDGVLGCSGIICKQSAPCSRQITTPTPHYSIFIGRVLFLAPNQQCQSTEDRSQVNNFINITSMPLHPLQCHVVFIRAAKNNNDQLIHYR